MGRFDVGPLKDALNAILGNDPREQGARDTKKKKTKTEEPIVPKRDERGTPYPGDFPNPTGDRNRGCF